MQQLDLANGYYGLPAGKLVNVVLCLEMKAKPSEFGEGLPAGFVLQRLGPQDLALHRAIFRDIGADLLWFSRLIMADDKLRSLLSDEAVESFVVRRGAASLAILELNFTIKDECELAFFGVAQQLIGTGLGRALMNEALQRAWARPINRLWLHTCHYDHPRALGFYQKAGFKAYARMIEVHDDPRLSGHLPQLSAVHIPLIERELERTGGEISGKDPG